MSGFETTKAPGGGEMCSNYGPFNLTSLPETINTTFPGKAPFRLHAATSTICNALKSNLTTNTLIWTPVLGPNAETYTEGDASNMTVFLKPGDTIVWYAAEVLEDDTNTTALTDVYWTGNYTFMTQEEMDQKKKEDEEKKKEKENGSISTRSLSLKAVLLFGMLGLGVATL